MKRCKVKKGREGYKRILCANNHFLGKEDEILYFRCKVCGEFFAYEEEVAHSSCKET